MSKENIRAFFTELEKQPELKAKFLAVTADRQKAGKEVMIGQAIDFGKAAGFTFNREDMQEFLEEMTDEQHANSELSDADLAQASGGAVDSSIFKVTINIFFSFIARGKCQE